MSAFHDQFKQDATFPDLYQWHTSTRPVFANAAVKYSVSCDGFCYSLEDEEEPEEQIEITAFCENGNGFGSYQEKS